MRFKMLELTWFTTIILGAGFLIVFIFFLEIATKHLLERLPYLSIVFNEFPEIAKSDISKFKSFDRELGWERQPNETRKKDTGLKNSNNKENETVVYSTDEYGSRVCEVSRKQNELKIATYGDSYCFCRDVSDNETIQHYLSQNLNAHVSNYGVGNYGLDQSLLRLERRFDDDPGDYVVLALCDKVLVNRLVSVWKHYFEFGNAFAVKPRFELKDSELVRVEHPLDSKDELLRIEDYATFFREYDHHYENWFMEKYQERPYFTYWVQNSVNVPFASLSIIEYLLRGRERFSNVHEMVEPIQQKYESKKVSNKWKYRIKLEEKFDDLLYAELGEFTAFVRERGAIPVFLPIRAVRFSDRYPMSAKRYKPLNDQRMKKIKENCPDLHIVDPREDIVNSVESLSELYVKEDPLGGHPSQLHNELNADYLAAFIQSIESNK